MAYLEGRDGFFHICILLSSNFFFSNCLIKKLFVFLFKVTKSSIKLDLLLLKQFLFLGKVLNSLGMLIQKDLGFSKITTKSNQIFQTQRTVAFVFNLVKRVANLTFFLIDFTLYSQ
jgi:hypothetical protein